MRLACRRSGNSVAGCRGWVIEVLIYSLTGLLIILTWGAFRYYLLYSAFMSSFPFVLQNYIFGRINSFCVGNGKFHSICRHDIVSWCHEWLCVFSKQGILGWVARTATIGQKQRGNLNPFTGTSTHWLNTSSQPPGQWCSSQADETDTWSKWPVHEQTTLLGLSLTFRSQHELNLCLTAETTTGVSIILLLQPDTSDSPTVYKYLATQLHLWFVQENETCSKSSRLTVIKNYLTAESMLSTLLGLYTKARTLQNTHSIHLIKTWHLNFSISPL